MNLNTHFSLSPLKTIVRPIIFILIQFISISLSAQNNKDIACVHANKLKAGTLIVVLETKVKKIALIERLVHKAGTSEKDVRKYQKLLSAEMKDRDTAWHYTTLGFNKLYKYSKVVFIMDTSLRVFLNNPEACKYYNANLKPIELNKTGAIYVAQYGHIFENQGTNLSDAWYVMDNKLNRLPSAFPEQIKFSFFNPSFAYKLPKSFLVENQITSLKAKHKPLLYAFKLDKMLFKFYRKSGRCSELTLNL